jgi:hypothetical protein
MRTHTSEGVNKILETIAVLKKAIAASEGDLALCKIHAGLENPSTIHQDNKEELLRDY